MKEMDIHSPKGTKVKGYFVKGKLQGGYETQNEEASKYILEGKVYTVDYTHVHNWYTNVFLIEYPGKLFNSVHFVKA